MAVTPNHAAAKNQIPNTKSQLNSNSKHRTGPSERHWRPESCNFASGAIKVSGNPVWFYLPEGGLRSGDEALEEEGKQEEGDENCAPLARLIDDRQEVDPNDAGQKARNRSADVTRLRKSGTQATGGPEDQDGGNKKGVAPRTGVIDEERQHNRHEQK